MWLRTDVTVGDHPPSRGIVRVEWRARGDRISVSYADGHAESFTGSEVVATAVANGAGLRSEASDDDARVWVRATVGDS